MFHKRRLCELRVAASRRVPRDTPSPIAEARGRMETPGHAMAQCRRSFSNFSIAGTGHIRNWKWASTAGPAKT